MNSHMVLQLSLSGAVQGLGQLVFIDFGLSFKLIPGHVSSLSLPRY